MITHILTLQKRYEILNKRIPYNNILISPYSLTAGKSLRTNTSHCRSIFSGVRCWASLSGPALLQWTRGPSVWKPSHKVHLPLSGRELKSPQSSSCTLSLCPASRIVRAESSNMLRSSLLSIIVWISFTSQNSGSQCMWAVQTRIGWPSIDESVGIPVKL